MSATLEHPMPLLAQRSRPTLEQTLERALKAGGECPICHGHMDHRDGEAVCRDCGSRLS